MPFCRILTIIQITIEYNPPCRTVMMVAEHLNIDLNFKFVSLGDQEQKSGKFFKMNPFGQVPVINDNGFYMSESRAISQYLCNEYAPDNNLYPRDPKKRAIVDRILSFDAGSYLPSLKQIYWPLFYLDKTPEQDKVNELKKNLSKLDSFLMNNKYFAGDHLTIADLSIYASSVNLIRIKLDLTDFPNFKSWFERLPKEFPYIDKVHANIEDGYKELKPKIKAYFSK